MIPFPSPLLSSLAVLIAYPMEGEGEKKGREEGGGGRGRGRARAYQRTFKQNAVNHLSITPAFLSLLSSPLPSPHPALSLHPGGVYSQFQSLPFFYTLKDFLYCFSSQTSSVKTSNLPIICSPERGKDRLEMYQVPPTNILKTKDI